MSFVYLKEKRKLFNIYQKQKLNYDLGSEFAFQCFWGVTRFETAVSLQIKQAVIKFRKESLSISKKEGMWELSNGNGDQGRPLLLMIDEHFVL